MIVTNLVEIHPIKNDIIYVKPKEGVDFTAEEIIKVHQIFEKMANRMPYKVIVDARDVSVGHVTMDTFNVTSIKKHRPNQIAEAYLFNTLHIRILINFYFKTFKPVIPSKMFQCPDEASNWLREIQANTLSLG